MVKNADKIGGGTIAMHDPRITKVGFFLRKTKLDETTNLINIILGTKAFIGDSGIIEITRRNLGFTRF